MRPKRSRLLFGNPFKRGLRQFSFIFSVEKSWLPAVLPFLALLIFLVLGYRFFTIRKIDCFLNSEPCSAEVTLKLDKYLGDNMLSLNQKKLIANLKTTSPFEKINLGFKLFNTLVVKIEGQSSPLNLKVALVSVLPDLEMDHFLGSTAAANFVQPTLEIEGLARKLEFVNFEIWNSGLMTPTASSESKIQLLLIEKPSLTIIKSIYGLIKIVEKYLTVDKYYILGDRVFLRQVSQPDIIINIPFEEDSLVQVLQSYAYLTTIKKDTKVIDLRFKNPILR